MAPPFLLYGATGYVGAAAARAAVAAGLRPVLGGRDAARLGRLAAELGLAARAFPLDDAAALDAALGDAPLVLHCAGPFLATSRPMADACLRTGAHYLDLTGELPVYAALAARDAEARARGVMLLPGVGFDVVPTDCLAVHLQRRLPSATRLALAFRGEGPAGAPPGTQRTAIELVPYGDFVRRGGRLVRPGRAGATRTVDFGRGPVRVTRLTWGDVFTAFHSTGIPDIEDFASMPASLRRMMGAMRYLRPLLRLAPLRRALQRAVRPGATADELARSSAHVWGEVTDDQGGRAVSRLHGPEAGVDWTVRAALAAVGRVLGGHAPAGFQTPGGAYGPDFVLDAAGVTREDVG